MFLVDRKERGTQLGMSARRGHSYEAESTENERIDRFYGNMRRGGGGSQSVGEEAKRRRRVFNSRRPASIMRDGEID